MFVEKDPTTTTAQKEEQEHYVSAQPKKIINRKIKYKSKVLEKNGGQLNDGLLLSTICHKKTVYKTLFVVQSTIFNTQQNCNTKNIKIQGKKEKLYNTHKHTHDTADNY